MAKEMKEISIKYQKEVSEIHALFESVCCNKETLIKILAKIATKWSGALLKT